MASEALNPSPTLLAKLASIVAHAEEGHGPDGHRFDLEAMKGGIADPDVQGWLRQMRTLALAPVPRKLPTPEAE